MSFSKKKIEYQICDMPIEIRKHILDFCIIKKKCNKNHILYNNESTNKFVIDLSIIVIIGLYCLLCYYIGYILIRCKHVKCFLLNFLVGLIVNSFLIGFIMTFYVFIKAHINRQF